MMKISVILSFLLCWSFVSPNPHHEKSNDKSVGESNHINDESDTLTLVRKKHSDEASSGKDWGENSLNHEDLDNTEKIHQTDDKFLLDKLIDQGSNYFKTLIPKNKLSDNLLFDNIIAWVQKNEAVSKLFTNEDDNLTNNDSEIKESSINEKIENCNDRAKRDLKATALGHLWANPHKGGISEHLLKLNDGSKVLKSEKATVAEALYRAAIRKILAEAKARAAKAAQHKNIYDNDDFSKWLLSGSSFDTSIFEHPFRLSNHTKITNNNQNNTDQSEIKDRLSNSTAIGIADIDRSHTKLLHKSEHQKHLSSKLQSTSGEKHGHDTNEMLHKLTISRHTHGLSSYEDEEDTRLRHISSHIHAPHMHSRITKDQETGNNIPKRKHAKWTQTDSSRAHASHSSHSAELYEFETLDDSEEYGRNYIFKTFFKPREDNEKIYYERWKQNKFPEEINIHEGDKTNYDHIVESSIQHDSSIDAYHEKNTRNKNKQNLDGMKHSILHSTTSTETKKGIENKQSENRLITKISTGESIRKPVNIDIKHYHSRDQSVAANSATSSSVSDDKGSKRTNNVLASPSVDDGSTTVETKTENDYNLLGRTRSVIGNDMTSTGIEMGFSGIRNHPSVGSSLSHAHSKTHLKNQKVHHSINNYEHSTANTVNTANTSKTKHLMDSKTLMESRNKEHELKSNKKIIANFTSSTETKPSIISERQHKVISDKQISDDNNDIKARSYIDLKKLLKNYLDHAGYESSIEVIDIDDDSAEVLLPDFPVHKHGKSHVLHNVNYNFDSQEISDNEKIKSAKDLKKIQIDYDNSEEKFSDNVKVSNKLQMITSNERLSHRHSQHGENDQYNQHNYYSDNNKQNRQKSNSQYNHRTYNQDKRHSQDNHYILNQQSHNIKSSTASNKTKFDNWNKYIYFIQEQKRKNNKSNASFEYSTSVIKEDKKQKNAKHEKILNKKEESNILDKDEQHYLRKHTNLSGPVIHSAQINKITSTNNNEEKIKNEKNTKNRNKIVTHVANLISDSSTMDTISRTKHRNQKINNNNNYSQTSWKLTSLKNPRANIQTEAEHVYDTHRGNENIDINTKQTVKTAQSTESKSNLQSVLSKTSELDNTKKIVADYQDYSDKVSGSSKLITKSQMDTNHLNKKLKSAHKINANTKILTKMDSLSDTMDKSQFNVQNATASSKSSAKSQIESWDYMNNKKYNTKASADTTAFIGVNNKQKSVLKNTSTLSKLFKKSEIESKKNSNNLNNTAISITKSGSLAEAVSKSIESKLKTEQKLNHNSIQRDSNVKISSIATSDNIKNEWFSPSKESHSKSHLTNSKDNQINSISKVSTESILLNNIEDQSHLQKSASSILSSQKSQAEYEHDNLQKNKINVSTAEVLKHSAAFNNNDNGYWSNLSKSSLSSKWIKGKHIKNKHYSDNIKVNHKDIGVTTEVGEISSAAIKNSHQQESISSSSSSSSSAKSQILNKNAKKIINSNNVFDLDKHQLLHTSSSSQSTSESNLNAQKSDVQTANTATILKVTNNDKYKQNNNLLEGKRLKGLTDKDHIKKFANNKSIERNKIIKSKLKDALNTATSVESLTSTDNENVRKTSSLSNSKTTSWTHNERDLNQLEKDKVIINDLVASKILNSIGNNHEDKLLTMSSLSNSHSKLEEKKKNHMNTKNLNKKSMNSVKTLSKSLFSTNNEQSQNDLINETILSKISKKAQKTQNNFDIAKEKIANEITISNSASKEHNNNLLKDTSVILNKKLQASNKIKNKNEINADNSHTESVINSRRIKYLKEDNNVNKLSTDLATLNSFNSENRNNMLKGTINDLYTEISEKDQHKSDILSNINKISNTNIQDKYQQGLISSTDTKIQSMIDHKSDILRKKEAINSEIRNNINKWNTKVQTTISSSNTGSQNGKESIETAASAESIANNINKNAHNSMQEKSVFNLINIVKANKQHKYGNQKADLANIGKIKAEKSNSQRFIEYFKDDAKKKTQSQQNKFKHKIITSNKKLSEETNSSEMENAHQKLLKDVAAATSRTKVQHEHISDIVKESLKVGSAATSAQAKSSKKVESKSQEKSVTDSTKSNSYAKSQIENKNDSSNLKEKQIIASIEALTNSAIFDNLKNVRQNKINKNLLSDLELHDTKNENRRKILKSNLANTADAIVSAKKTSTNVIKDKYQTGVKLSDLYAETQTVKHGYNSNLQRKSIHTTASNDIKEHAEKKSAVNNIKESSKAITNTATSAKSSNSIENTNTQDLSKILASSNLHTATDNVHSRNVLQNGQKRLFTITQASPTSLVISTNNQDKQNEILHSQDSTNQRITKIKHNNNFLREDFDNKDAEESNQATSFNNVKNKHQHNLLKTTSLINSFAGTQNMQKDESSIRRKQHLITADSTASSDSNISSYINSINKNNVEKLTGISSSNSYAKSNAQNKNYVDILKKKHTGIFNANKSKQAIISNKFKNTKQNNLLQTTTNSIAKKADTKIDNNSIKKALNAALNANAETISFNEIKNTDSNGLFDPLVNAPSKKLIENKNSFQKDVIKNNFPEISLDLFSKAQVESAHDSKILKTDSAIVNTLIKTKSSNYRNQQEDLHKTRSLSSNAQDSQHNVESISSENSHVAIPATNKNVVKNGKVKNNGEINFNLSTLRNMNIHNKIKKEHLNNWSITNSDIATLAEKRTENKNKLNDSKTEKVTIHTGTAAAIDNIENEQHDIHVKGQRKLEDDWNAETNIWNTILGLSTDIDTLKQTKNNSERKSILSNKLATLSSNEARAKNQLLNKEKYGIMGISKSSANTEETQRSITSAMSSASTSNNMNIDLGTKYDQLNNKVSTSSLITSASKDDKERGKHLSSVQTSLHLSNKVNGCNKDVKTKEFIKQASSLYKILGKQQDSEILLMKKNSKGPVQIASLKNSVPPLIAYRLIPREVYERIRTILANKQIFCTNCPLSNN